MARFKSRKQGNRSRKTYGGAFIDAVKNIIASRAAVSGEAATAAQSAAAAEALASAAQEKVAAAALVLQNAQAEQVRITAEAAAAIEKAKSDALTAKNELDAATLTQKNELDAAATKKSKELEDQKDADIKHQEGLVKTIRDEVADATQALRVAAAAANQQSAALVPRAQAVSNTKLEATLSQLGGRRRRTHKRRAHKSHKRSHRK